MNNSSFNNKPSKAFERPNINKSKPILNQEENFFSPVELNQSCWGRLVLFLNNSYGNFIPRNYQKQSKQISISKIQDQCITMILSNNYSSWNDLLDDLDKNDYQYEIAENFCFYLSKKYSEKLDNHTNYWQEIIKKFVELFELIINNNSSDLIKLGEFADLVDEFNKSQQRTFWFLSQLPNFVDKKSQKMLLTSNGYKEIIKYGASEFLSDFGLKLQREFRLTRTALKEQAAQNLVQELGETETNLKSEIQRLELINKELENQIETIKTQSFNDAIYQLAKSLQDEQQPVLDQLFNLHKRLDILLENNESLSPQETLTCFISLDALFKAFKSINITQFPENINQSFEITGLDLDEHKYNYIAGSQFTSKEDKKIVKCVAPGWCVNSTIVTPAKVEEIIISE